MFSIRRKFLSIYIPGFAVLMIMLLLLTRNITLLGFTELETARVENNNLRVVNAIARDQMNLGSKIFDWAVWDDTYAFMQNENPEFLESNINEDTLLGLNINFIIFLDNNLAPVFTYYVNHETKSEQQLNPLMLQFFLDNKELFQFESNIDTKTGFVDVDSGIYQIALMPITDTSAQAPAVGTAIFGVLFDDDYADSIGEQTLVNIDAKRLTDAEQDPEFKVATENLIKGNAKNGSYVSYTGTGSVHGFSIISDIKQNPVMVIRSIGPTEIIDQGNNTILYNILNIAILGIVMGFFIARVTEIIIVNRISKLTSNLKTIIDSNNLEVKIHSSGQDEISAMADMINNLLERIVANSAELEKNQEISRQRSEELEKMNKSMLGRESRMIELKEEIDSLKKQLASRNDNQTT